MFLLKSLITQKSNGITLKYFAKDPIRSKQTSTYLQACFYRTNCAISRDKYSNIEKNSITSTSTTTLNNGHETAKRISRIRIIISTFLDSLISFFSVNPLKRMKKNALKKLEKNEYGFKSEQNDIVKWKYMAISVKRLEGINFGHNLESLESRYNVFGYHTTQMIEEENECTYLESANGEGYFEIIRNLELEGKGKLLQDMKLSETHDFSNILAPIRTIQIPSSVDRKFFKGKDGLDKILYDIFIVRYKSPQDISHQLLLLSEDVVRFARIRTIPHEEIIISLCYYNVYQKRLLERVVEMIKNNTAPSWKKPETREDKNTMIKLVGGMNIISAPIVYHPKIRNIVRNSSPILEFSLFLTRRI